MVWLIGGLAGLCFSAEGSVRDWSSLYFSRELVAPLSVAGWGYSAFSALMAAGRFGGDWIRSHIGERMLVTACGTVAGVGFVLTAVTSDYPIAVAGFSLVGIGLSNIVPIFISVAGRSINSAASISIVVAMGYSGFLISPPILGAVAGLTSLATIFLLVGAMSMLIALTWAFIPVRPTK
jgi:MFS family permease